MQSIFHAGNRSAPQHPSGLSEGQRLARVWVIIPVLNEEASLPLVLRDLPPVGRVLVVDNGSTDRSATIARQWGATVITAPRRGYGAACLAGLHAITELATETPPPEVVVFLDGDYSDYPELLPQLVEPIFQGKADFVLGSRCSTLREPGSMPVAARLGNRLATTLIWLFWGARFNDLGPFRAISWSALQRLKMADRDFGWTIEMQIKATLAGLRYQEIPIPYRRRRGKSKISGTIRGTIQAGYKILYTIFRYVWLTKIAKAQPWS